MMRLSFWGSVRSSLRLAIPLLSLGFIVLPGSISQAVAQSSDAEIASGIGFRPRSDNPYPEETESSGVRNDALCSQDSQASASELQKLRAIAPAGALKLTASARPVIWIAIPKTRAQRVVFSLEKINNDAQQSREFHSQKTYSISQSPTLMGLKMPEDAPDLELETFYQWSVLLVCDESPHPSDPFVFASIKRVTPLRSSVSDDQTKLYSRALSQDGFWYDPISILLEAYQANPQDSELSQLWQTLVESADLEIVSQKYGPSKSLIQFP